MLLAAIWADSFHAHFPLHTHTQTHRGTFILPFLLFSILPLCKCVFCSSSATRSFIHEPARWRRDGLIYSQLTLRQPAGHAVCCVLCVAVCTHHLHLLRLFESNSLLRSSGDFFIYLFKGKASSPCYISTFSGCFYAFSPVLKCENEGQGREQQNGRRNQSYFPFGDAEIVFFFFLIFFTEVY